MPRAIQSAPSDVVSWMSAPAEEREHSPGGYAAPAPTAAADDLGEQMSNLTWQDLAVLCGSIAWTAGFVFIIGWTAIVNFRFGAVRPGVRRRAMTVGSSSCGVRPAPRSAGEGRFRSSGATRSSSRR